MAKVYNLVADDTIPKYGRPAFVCPHCGVLAQQIWNTLNYDIVASDGEHNYLYTYNKKNMHHSKCQNRDCNKQCLWVGTEMILPSVSNFPQPNADTPKKIKEIYDEAVAIANKSPRAAAALIRLALQELCMHLKCKGKTLQENIDFLVKEKELPRRVEKAMDAVRIIGNEAVHPGTIDLQDNNEVVATMLKLLNFIVEKMISDPKEMDAFYATLPDSKKRKGTQQ